MVKSPTHKYLTIYSARQRYMFDYVSLIKRDQRLMADIMTEEHGKTTPDSMGDVQRGLEVVEASCGMSHIISG